jgi:coproporphyrinogen III oxidase
LAVLEEGLIIKGTKNIRAARHQKIKVNKSSNWLALFRDKLCRNMDMMDTNGRCPKTPWKSKRKIGMARKNDIYIDGSGYALR